MPQSRPQRLVSRSSTTELDPSFCALFHGVCADCPNEIDATHRSDANSASVCRLPPLAEGALDALVRCRKLTQRERQVLTLCCSGLKNDAIARVLRISRSAVRRHLCNLHKKTNTSDKAELILNLWHSCRACPEAADSRQGPSSPRPRRVRAGPKGRQAK